MDAVFEDAQKQVAEIERSYLDSIEQLNNEYQKVLRLEQIKAKSENDARRRAEDAARKLTDQVHQLKAENEELKEQHAEEIQEIQKKYELFDEFNRLCSDESTLLDRHMRSKIYNHPSNVSEREYQRDLQLERERKQQLQLEKERDGSYNSKGNVNSNYGLKGNVNSNYGLKGNVNSNYSLKGNVNGSYSLSVKGRRSSLKGQCKI